MIYVLHGEDIESSNQRLRAITSDNSAPKLTLNTSENSLEDLSQAVSSVNLFDQVEFIVCINFIGSKKIKPQFINSFSKDKTIVFWEKSKIGNSFVSQLKKEVKVDYFKPTPYLFQFLDSVVPGVGNLQRASDLLHKVGDQAVLWHLANRVLMLILAKRGDILLASKIAGRQILAWQWDKLVKQSRGFSNASLVNIYGGVLKLDYMAKSGESDFNQRTMIHFLLAKYLPVVK